MEVRQSNSITGVGSPASARVANSLAPRQAAAKTSATAKPMATSSAAGAAADSADITSSDFLTLLVSELQNQDPTQPADPNAYISQLVGVNSLQQLIQINQGLSAVEGGSVASNAATGNARPSGDQSASVSGANSVAG